MRNQKGITLIEMLISLVLSAIVMAGAYRVFIAQATAYSIQEDVADAQNAVRAGMETLTGDLRMAGYDPENGVAISSTSVSGTGNTIRLEWEGAGAPKVVQYRAEGGKLIRTVNGEDQEVLDDVSTLAFAYITSGSKIIRIDATLVVKNRSLQTSVMRRNVN